MATKAVMYSDPSGMVRKVKLGDNELEVSGASVITQGGRVGMSLTILDLEVSGEPYQTEGQQGGAGPGTPLSPVQAS